jgi:hypothetical protein
MGEGAPGIKGGDLYPFIPRYHKGQHVSPYEWVMAYW